MIAMLVENEYNTALSQDDQQTAIVIIDEHTIRDKIYVVRGVKVMLDFELAEIYGYTTSAFNQQVKNNLSKFDDDFRFQLTRDEIESLSISKNLTSIQMKGTKGGRSKLPFAFTESGIYMLMTVLKGDLAVRQSKALIRAFRAMKDYIIENQDLIGRHDLAKLEVRVDHHDEKLTELGDQMKEVLDKMGNLVTKSELSPFLLDFGKPTEKHEFLILNGEPALASETYINIYSKAKTSIHIVDDYINIKSLRLLQDVKPGVKVTIFSDNQYNKLHQSDVIDFQTEFPGIQLDFIQTQHTTHDRFIVLDYGTSDEIAYHCGASSKDAGNRMTAISEFRDQFIKESLDKEIAKMMGYPSLVLS